MKFEIFIFSLTIIIIIIMTMITVKILFTISLLENTIYNSSQFRKHLI